MAQERVPMTVEGKKQLEAELNRLKRVERPKAIKAIAEARAHGDLSENAEYDAAKNHQGHLEARIRDLEDKLSRAEVIPPANGKPERVTFGVQVTVVDVDSEKESSYRIVGELEADPENNRLSITSPMARAFIGKEVGDEVTLRTPGGVRNYEVVDIDA